jgi:hypothetical protein
MKVFNKGERQYMIGNILIKPQQTADIDDKYKSIVESYKEFEVVEPEVVTTKAKKTSKKK